MKMINLTCDIFEPAINIFADYNDYLGNFIFDLNQDHKITISNLFFCIKVIKKFALSNPGVTQIEKITIVAPFQL